jgi:predicted flap endonuclease-1-like 5' DNA nuclease
MNYCFNAEALSLSDLKNRITSTDLVPSREPLLNGLDGALAQLEGLGIKNMAGLRRELKDNKRLFAIADQTGIDKDYLALLRREVESYIPKPFSLKNFDWIPAEEIAKLDVAGVKTTADLFENPEKAKASGLETTRLDHLLKCADLTRIQWVSPLTARMLIGAGYATPASVAAAIPEELDKGMQAVNTENAWFNGRIGLRDIMRLIEAARYVSLWY